MSIWTPGLYGLAGTGTCHVGPRLFAHRVGVIGWNSAPSGAKAPTRSTTTSADALLYTQNVVPASAVTVIVLLVRPAA